MSKHLSWGMRQAEAAEVAFRGLALLGDRVSADRARLLATAANAIAWAPSQVDHAAVETMFSDALAMAEELGGEALMGSVLLAKAITDSGWLHLRELTENDRRGIELLRSAGRA